MKDMTTVQVRLGSGTPNGLYAMDLYFLRMPDGQAALPPNG